MQKKKKIDNGFVSKFNFLTLALIDEATDGL